MLKIISILTLLYFLSSTAVPESNYNHDAYEGYKDNNQQPLPLQLAEAASRSYYGAGGKQVKPCSRRKLKDPLDIADQELLPTPTYTARVIKPYQGNANNNLTPQSLRNAPNQDSVDKLSGVQHNYKNTKADNSKLNADSVDVKNVKSYSDKVNSDNDDVETKAYNKKIDESNDVRKQSKTNSKVQDVSEYGSKNTNANNAKLDGSSYEDKNSKFHAKDPSGDYYKVKTYDDNDKLDAENYSVKNADDELNAGNYNTKNLQAHSKELNDAQSKSSNKYLTEAQFKALTGNADSKELDGAGYKNLNYNSNKGSYYESSKGTYDTPNKNKVYGDELNSAYYKNNDDELSSEDSEKKYLLHSDEIEGAIQDVKLNRASSDELNDALYEIRKHMAHSEELKDALREVGKKGKIYNNLLTDVLFKVRKHEALSQEFNKDRYGDKSGEPNLSYEDPLYEENSRPYSNEKYGEVNSSLKKSKHYSPSESGYKESDQLSREKDSYEDDQKCPSKQQSLTAEQPEASRRLLSDSEESKVSDSTLSKNYVARKNTGNKKGTKKYAHDNDDSKTAVEKEGEEYDRSNQQASAVMQRRNKLSKVYRTNPAQGPGVSELSASGLNLMDHRRVCYACSSEFNPTCYEPNRQTTVKYCLYGQDNCVTKTYTNSESKQVVIRDCADSCNVGIPGTDTVWNSCVVCTTDLCNDDKVSPNGAFSINGQSLMFTVFVILAIKFTM